ncbi:hypothetical protein AVEN_177196-1 [Araneus ventricosus]|uniref:Uncharacterized protein n=1 Tax=Araneus ventricosus TaxID=182803 RepID=A0A4Y2JX82_ARAVE|nr:hypothetical protein AVEN_177196-1 [Araneus ventricosus]
MMDPATQWACVTNGGTISLQTLKTPVVRIASVITLCPPRELWLPKYLVYGGRYSNWLCKGRSISNRRNPTEIGVLFYSWRQFEVVKRVVDHSSSRLPYIAHLALNAPM